MGEEEPQRLHRGVKSVKTLLEIYANLPRLECKGLCSRSCGPINFSLKERAAMEANLGHSIGVVSEDFTCPALIYGQCSVYENRPLICRLWGAVEEMRCPFGCVPERWLTKEEQGALLEQIAPLSETTLPCSLDELIHAIKGLT